MTGSIKITVFWDMRPWSLREEELATCNFSVEDEAVKLKIWVMIYHTIQDHNPEDSKLQIMNCFQYPFIKKTYTHFSPVWEDENICVINYHQLEITVYNDGHTIVMYTMGASCVIAISCTVCWFNLSLILQEEVSESDVWSSWVCEN